MRVLLVIITVLSFVILFLNGSVDADLIIMKNGLRHKCKVIKDNPDDDHITVRLTYDNGKTGTITILRKNINRIEYDYDSRKKRLDKSDFTGHFDLAEFCLQHNMEDEAFDLLKQCVGKPGVPDDALLILARIYEKKGKLQEALELYIKYYNKHPNDTEVYKKIGAINKKIKQMKSPSPSPTKTKIPQTTVKPPPKTPPVSIKVIEGLEANPAWIVAPWAGSGMLESKLLCKNKLLSFQFNPGASTKSACFLVLSKPIERNKNSSFNLKVHNINNNPVQLSLALWIGEGTGSGQGEYYESQIKVASPGKWTELNFDFDAKWKRRPKWTYSETLPQKKIWVVFLLVYPGGEKGTVEFDEITFQS